MTKNEIDKEILKFEPKIEPDSNDMWAYRILLTAPVVGPFKSSDEIYQKISTFWGVKNWKIRRMCIRAWSQKIIRFGKNHQEQFLCGETYDDGLGFAMGAACLNGLIKRVKEKSDSILKSTEGT